MSDPSVRVVHLVAKTHLDLGFTDLADVVVEQYVQDFFPRAISVAQSLRRLDDDPDAPRLVWTTGSWILREALDRRGSQVQREAVADAVERGDLAWHGLPFTTHTELLDADLFRHGSSISAGLDERFGRHTTAAKMTDVPGHTRSMVPLLAEAGVGFLHIGVNPAWPLPDVPGVFRWRSPDGSEVVVAYSAGGYGADVVVPGCDVVLAFLHSGDNLGPPTADEVVAAYEVLGERYPGAEIRASTLSAFAEDLAASGAVSGLPVVTAEIGDPWIFGAASDPQKVTAYRRILSARDRMGSAMPKATRTELDDNLLLVAEHTWGLDEKVVLPTEVGWDGDTLAQLRRSSAGQRFESSWAEQRFYVDEAAVVLAACSLGFDYEDPWSAATFIPERRRRRRRRIDSEDPLFGFSELSPYDAEIPVDEHWKVRIDLRNGAIVGLRRSGGGRPLADEDHPLGLLLHQTFTAAAYDRFYAQLTPSPQDEWWAVRDNTKPGIGGVGPAQETLQARCVGTWWTHSCLDARVEVLSRVTFPDTHQGAPLEAWLHWRWVDHVDLRLDLEVRWVDKPATRLPEATWLSFVPNVRDPSAWRMDKLGQPVSPIDVVSRGGRSLHAVGRGGLTYDGPDGPLRIETADAPLVAPGKPNLLDADPPIPDLSGGWHVLLHDNCWGTNFPMWNDEPAAFRFSLSMVEPSATR
ncbi:MAG: DUF5054 domain-containing protein [Acidimicrobiales bacterium]|nr:DUF5054 domain-containing protein [Acidimicrobiales bacterium]